MLRLSTLVASLASAAFFGVRHIQLGRMIDTRKAEMAVHLRPGADASEEATTRVAKAVHNDEDLFNETLTAVAAKRTAGLLGIASLGMAFLSVLSIGWKSFRERDLQRPHRDQEAHT